MELGELSFVGTAFHAREGLCPVELPFRELESQILNGCQHQLPACVCIGAAKRELQQIGIRVLNI